MFTPSAEVHRESVQHNHRGPLELQRLALQWTGSRLRVVARHSRALVIQPMHARTACACCRTAGQRREHPPQALCRCSNRRLSLTLPKSPARHHRAAVQSNEVYPTPLTSARLSCFGAASDKRFTLGVTVATQSNTHALSCAPAVRCVLLSTSASGSVQQCLIKLC